MPHIFLISEKLNYVSLGSAEDEFGDGEPKYAKLRPMRVEMYLRNQTYEVGVSKLEKVFLPFKELFSFNCLIIRFILLFPIINVGHKNGFNE